MNLKFGNDLMNRVSRGKIALICWNEPSENRANALECRRKSVKRNKENDAQVSNIKLFNFCYPSLLGKGREFPVFPKGDCGCWKSLSTPVKLTPTHSK
jgi:hypothetical protein